jgi:hypothetical protein
MSSKNKGKRIVTSETPVVETTTPTPTPVDAPIESADLAKEITEQSTAAAPAVSAIDAPAETIVDTTLSSTETLVDAPAADVDNETPAPDVVEEVVTTTDPVADAIEAPISIYVVAPDDAFIVSLIKERMVKYVADMDIKANVSVATRIQAQKSLKSTIDSVLKTGGSDFSLGLDVLLAIVHSEPIVFNPRYLFRNFNDMGLDSTAKLNLENILHLLTTIADPQTRRSYAQQIDIRKALKGYAHNEPLMQLFMEYLSR